MTCDSFNGYELWCFEDLEENDRSLSQSVSQSVNDRGVYRTTPATPVNSNFKVFLSVKYSKRILLILSTFYCIYSLTLLCLKCGNAENYANFRGLRCFPNILIV